ncbi:hypothetical protein IQ06DRAFT_234125 [Phaeosphaeriaceae sp. SRC1lsM3a]|nr:hypothetical protein IQ06DRAFT_234125 [Stagonospora sp. SRC1lsM3a]
MLAKAIFTGCMLALASAMPQGTVISAPPQASTPSADPIPWATKIDEFRAWILEQPDQNATKARNGPSFQKTFTDGDCLQLRFLDWDCNHDLPYKMRGVVKWLDDENLRDGDGSGDKYRWYLYGYYVDPDDGWMFYNSARLSFGFCGNRGPQSACGVNYCVDKSGNSRWGVDPGMDVPAGQTPWMDPNDRDRLCPWLRDNATTTLG